MDLLFRLSVSGTIFIHVTRDSSAVCLHVCDHSKFYTSMASEAQTSGPTTAFAAVARHVHNKGTVGSGVTRRNGTD